MNDAISECTRRIHAAPTMLALALSGSGSMALQWLLGTAGASRTVLEAVVPYGRRALHDYLGWTPLQYVTPETARALAAVACMRACRLSESDAPLIGVSCTAAIVTDRARAGPHCAYMGVCNMQGIVTCSLTMTKGARDRLGEEQVVSQLLLRAIADGCGLDDCAVPLDLLPNEEVVRSEVTTDALLEQFAAGGLALTYLGCGIWMAEPPRESLILPLPMFEAEWEYVRKVEREAGRGVYFQAPYERGAQVPTRAELEAQLEGYTDEGYRVLVHRPEIVPDNRAAARTFPVVME